MPDLVPSLAPAASVAGVSPVATAPSGARDGGAGAAHASSGAFVDKLQAALAQLAGGSPLSPDAPVAQPLQVPETDSQAAAEPVPAAGGEAAGDDSSALGEELPELLAALGFLLLPPTLVPSTPVAKPDAGGLTAGATDAAAPGPLLPALEERAWLPAQAQAPAQVGQTAPHTTEPDTTPPDTAAVVQPGSPATQAPAASSPHLDALQPQAAQARASEHASATRDAPSALQPALVATHLAHGAGAAHGGARHDNSGAGGDSREAPSELEVLNGSSNDPLAQAASTANGTATTATATSVATTPQPEPRAVSPSHVVAQIAHQAELYRLPGNRGVRVQLHPEDLGGLQVTVRYGAAGGLELHVNVEHAETGALVQSGWTELRDALALQGIAPERLIMNVTGGGDSNPTNFADRGLGSSLAGFGQSQGGQQRREQPSAPSSRGWLDSIDASPRPVEDARPLAGGTSRIDYRA